MNYNNNNFLNSQGCGEGSDIVLGPRNVKYIS